MPIFNVFIEISKGSQLKYELNKEDNSLHLDRVLFGSNIYPQNYGFIPKTLDHDGDPLDVVVISNYSIIPGATVECRILGAIGMIDGGDRDTKLVAVVNVDNRYKNFKTFGDIPKEWIDEIVDFFKNYKNLENKTVEVLGPISLEETKKIIEEGISMYQEQK